MHWEKSVPTSFVSDSGDSGFSEFGQTRSDCKPMFINTKAPRRTVIGFISYVRSAWQRQERRLRNTSTKKQHACRDHFSH